MRRLALGLALLALAGCTLVPTAGRPAGRVFAGQVLPGAGGAVRPLTAGAGGSALTLPPSGVGLLALTARGPEAAQVAVEIAPAAEAPAAAFRLAEAPAFEARLRQWERRALDPARARPARRLLAEAAEQVGDVRSFWIIVDLEDGGAREERVEARCVHAGPSGLVYLDAAADPALAERAAQLGEAFDARIYPTNTRIFGAPPEGVPGPERRVTILVSPSVGNGGEATTLGYFTARDLFGPEAPGAEHSNRRMMLYLAESVLTSGSDADALGTLSHESQHLLNAARRLFSPGVPAKLEEAWLDEALAMYAMEANGYGLAGDSSVILNHVSAYLSYPGAYSLTDWEENPEGAGYGAAYLWAVYAVERFGEALCGALVGGGGLTGVANVEARLAERGGSFAALFDDWAAATLLDGTDLEADGRFGYRTLDMLGAYRGLRLPGVALEPVTLPRLGQVRLRPHTARYFYLPSETGGSFQVRLSEPGASVGGWLVTP